MRSTLSYQSCDAAMLGKNVTINDHQHTLVRAMLLLTYPILSVDIPFTQFRRNLNLRHSRPGQLKSFGKDWCRLWGCHASRVQLVKDHDFQSLACAAQPVKTVKEKDSNKTARSIVAEKTAGSTDEALILRESTVFLWICDASAPHDEVSPHCLICSNSLASSSLSNLAGAKILFFLKIRQGYLLWSKVCRFSLEYDETPFRKTGLRPWRLRYMSYLEGFSSQNKALGLVHFLSSSDPFFLDSMQRSQTSHSLWQFFDYLNGQLDLLLLTKCSKSWYHKRVYSRPRKTTSKSNRRLKS